MTEKIDSPINTYMTGPAWRMACKTVRVGAESSCVSGTSGAGEIGDAGVCASKEVVVAAATNRAKIFMPKVL
jgi:hypothetical protein